MVLALNTVSGQIADISPKFLQHPDLKDILVVVDEDKKPYASDIYKGGNKDEKSSFRKNKLNENTSSEVTEIEEQI